MSGESMISMRKEMSVGFMDEEVKSLIFVGAGTSTYLDLPAVANTGSCDAVCQASTPSLIGVFSLPADRTCGFCVCVWLPSCAAGATWKRRRLSLWRSQ